MLKNKSGVIFYFSYVILGGPVFFDVNKLIGMIAYIMKKMDVASMNYLKLIKLMYLSDREFINLYDCSISNDEYFSLDKGPILSRMLNLIRQDTSDALQNVWDRFFTRSHYDLLMNGCLAYDKIEELSKAEMQVIDSVVEKYGKMDVWPLVDNVMHKLPEWKDPQGSAIPIHFVDIMKALNKSEKEIAVALEERRAYEEERKFCDKVLA